MLGDASRVTTGLVGFLDKKMNRLYLTVVLEQAKGGGEEDLL